MVEASQQMAQCSIDHDTAVEFSVAADRAAIEGRRLVQEMVKAEREAAKTAKPFAKPRLEIT